MLAQGNIRYPFNWFHQINQQYGNGNWLLLMYIVFCTQIIVIGEIYLVWKYLVLVAIVFNNINKGLIRNLNHKYE